MTAPPIIAEWYGTMDKKRRVPSNDIVAILQILIDLFMIIFIIRIFKLHILLPKVELYGSKLFRWKNCCFATDGRSWDIFFFETVKKDRMIRFLNS